MYFCGLSDTLVTLVLQDKALGGWGVAVAVLGGIETFITWFVACMACCWAPYFTDADRGVSARGLGFSAMLQDGAGVGAGTLIPEGSDLAADLHWQTISEFPDAFSEFIPTC